MCPTHVNRKTPHPFKSFKVFFSRAYPIRVIASANYNEAVMVGEIDEKESERSNDYCSCAKEVYRYSNIGRSYTHLGSDTGKLCMYRLLVLELNMWGDRE